MTTNGSLHPPELLLISVSGHDRPGVTAALTSILAEFDVPILDIGQRVIHDQLSLGLLVRIPEAAHSAPVVKDVLFKAHELGLGARFTPIDAASYGQWVAAQGKARSIITVLGRQLTALHLHRVAEIISAQGLNIDAITRLSGRIPLEPDQRAPYACVELSVRGEPADRAAMKGAFLRFAHETGVDIAFQTDDIYRRNRRLVAFDMDSTLIQTEVIDELAIEAGAGPQVAAITEASMRGELDYRSSLKRRLELLAGLEESALARVAERLPLTEGAERLVRTLKQLGFIVAIISGGFTYFGKQLQEKLGIDELFANELEIENGRITGRIVGEVIDRPRKAELLRELARRHSISLQQCIAVGDGANDLDMLSAAGLGIAFRAKPLVKERAENALSGVGLDAILYLIGVRDRETELAESRAGE